VCAFQLATIERAATLVTASVPSMAPLSMYEGWIGWKTRQSVAAFAGSRISSTSCVCQRHELDCLVRGRGHDTADLNIAVIGECGVEDRSAQDVVPHGQDVRSVDRIERSRLQAASPADRREHITHYARGQRDSAAQDVQGAIGRRESRSGQCVRSLARAPVRDEKRKIRYGLLGRCASLSGERFARGEKPAQDSALAAAARGRGPRTTLAQVPGDDGQAYFVCACCACDRHHRGRIERGTSKSSARLGAPQGQCPRARYGSSSEMQR